VTSTADFALRNAARLGHAAIVRALLAAGADPRAAHDDALFQAAKGGHVDVVKVCDLDNSPLKHDSLHNLLTCSQLHQVGIPVSQRCCVKCWTLFHTAGLSWAASHVAPCLRPCPYVMHACMLT
jgi:hypothetical protein